MTTTTNIIDDKNSLDSPKKKKQQGCPCCSFDLFLPDSEKCDPTLERRRLVEKAEENKNDDGDDDVSPSSSKIPRKRNKTKMKKNKEQQQQQDAADDGDNNNDKEKEDPSSSSSSHNKPIFYFGFSHSVNYAMCTSEKSRKKGKEAVQAVPLNRLLVESDVHSPEDVAGGTIGAISYITWALLSSSGDNNSNSGKKDGDNDYDDDSKFTVKDIASITSNNGLTFFKFIRLNFEL